MATTPGMTIRKPKDADNAKDKGIRSVTNKPDVFTKFCGRIYENFAAYLEHQKVHGVASKVDNVPEKLKDEDVVEK